MKTFIAVALFVIAIGAFFVAGQFQKNEAVAAREASAIAVSEAQSSLSREIEEEQSGRVRPPEERTAFLQRQRMLIANIKVRPVPGPQAPTPGPAPSSPVQPSSAPIPQAPSIIALMPVIVTAVLGVLSIGIILSTRNKPDDEARKWALGTLGVIIGFWLKG